MQYDNMVGYESTRESNLRPILMTGELSVITQQMTD